MKRDLSFKRVCEPIVAEVFKVAIRNTEYIFDELEGAKLFKLGYEHGFENKEPVSLVKDYKHGFQVGVNDSARGSLASK